MLLDRTYFLPTIYAGLVHLLVLIVVSGVWIGQQHPEMERPRHIEATMIDIDQLANMNAAQQQANETELNRQREEQAAAQRRQAAEEQRRQDQLAQERRAQEQAEADARAREEAARRAEEKASQEAQRIAQERAAAEARARTEAQAREAQLRAESERKEAEVRRQAEADRRAAEEARVAAERRRADEQRRQEEAARAEAARAEAERQRAAQARAAEEAKARDEEARRRAAAEQRNNQVVGDIQSYLQSELAKSWNIPSTARNGMQAVIAIHLFPNGQVDQVYVDKSSGDQAFDRSAVQAVQRVGQFSRVADVDPILFERRLRKVLVTFRPEGLRW